MKNKQTSNWKDYHNYLLQRFNNYETPIQMSAEQVRELLERFRKDYEDNFFSNLHSDTKIRNKYEK